MQLNVGEGSEIVEGSLQLCRKEPDRRGQNAMPVHGLVSVSEKKNSCLYRTSTQIGAISFGVGLLSPLLFHGILHGEGGWFEEVFPCAPLLKRDVMNIRSPIWS